MAHICIISVNHNLQAAVAPHTTLSGKKNCTILFLQYLCEIFLYVNNYWYTYTLINLEQNNIKIISLLRKVSLYCVVKCSVHTRVMTNIGFVT